MIGLGLQPLHLRRNNETLLVEGLSGASIIPVYALSIIKLLDMHKRQQHMTDQERKQQIFLEEDYISLL